MNKNDMSNNNTQNNFSIIDLENLQQQYSVLLLQYKTAVFAYNNYLYEQTLPPCSSDTTTDASCNSTANAPKFITVKGQAYMGTGSAGPSNSTNLNKCVASCTSNSKCTGATFVSNKCNLRIGDTSTIKSSENSYAIITREKQMLMNIEEINEQLIVINKKIINQINIAEPIYDTNVKHSEYQTEELIKNYAQLQEERNNILDVMEQYDKLDNVEKQNQIFITKNYYSYILLTILTLAISVLLYKIYLSTNGETNMPTNVQYGGELGHSAYYIIFFIALIGLIMFLIKRKAKIN